MIVIFAVLLASLAMAQPPAPVNSPQQYGFKVPDASVSLTAGSTETLTVSQPAGPKRTVAMYRAVAQCNANAFLVTQAQNGTDATATAATIVSLNPQQISVLPLAKAWTASNVGTGTAVEVPLGGAGGFPMVLDLTPISLPQNSPNINYSITIKNNGSGTDTCSLSVQWFEQ